MTGEVTIERVGLLDFEWVARGVIVRPIEGRRLVILPVPDSWTTCGRGSAFTRWGAHRAGKRALRRYCAPRPTEVRAA